MRSHGREFWSAHLMWLDHNDLKDRINKMPLFFPHIRTQKMHYSYIIVITLYPIIHLWPVSITITKGHLELTLGWVSGSGVNG